VVKMNSEMVPPRRGGRRVKVFIKKCFDLCELGVSYENALKCCLLW
jgi:hypothetical protein